jgi:N-acyl-D-amino-acid deacylase
MKFFAVGIVLLLGWGCAEPQYSVLIRNATIVDGTGGAPYTGSVLIGADTIAYVGANPLTNVRADTVIDAAGRVVSPGFIDPHAHGDPFRTPGFENFRRMGVTTIVLGMDGSSDGAEDPATYMRRLDSLNTGISVLMKVGHRTLRRMTDGDIPLMVDLIRTHLDAGYIGLSTGIEYYPGYLSTPDELAAIAVPVGEAGNVISSHVRNEDVDQIDATVRELIEQGRRGGSRVQVSHLKLVFGNDPRQAAAIFG